MNDMTKDMQESLWNGSGEQKFSFMYENLQGEVKKHTTPFEGIIPLLRRRHREAFSERMRLDIESFMTSTPCPVPRRAFKTGGAVDTRRRQKYL